MAWQRVASLDALRDGGVVGVDVGGTPIALFRLGNEVHATHGICTHALARLAEGWVEDGKVECPLHQGLFDIRTGKALCTPVTKDLETYAVKLEGEDVLVDLDRRAGSPEPVEVAVSEASSAAGRDVARVVVVGAGQAAAAAIRTMRVSGYAGAIDLVGEELHLPYERPPLSKDFLHGKADAASCCRLDAADAASHGVTLHLGRRATAVDAAARTVTLDDDPPAVRCAAPRGRRPTQAACGARC